MKGRLNEIRHEFYHGELIPLDENCVIALRSGLRGSGCKVFDENGRTEEEAGSHYTYPDVVVTCNQSTDTDGRTVHRPTLLIEVLSASTEARDRSVKLDQYLRLPSLRQIVFIHQKLPLVHSYARPEVNQRWIVSSFRELTDGLALPLAAIYDEVELGPLRVWRAE